MKQITIIAPVQSGLVASVSRCLADAGVNLEELEAHDAKESVVVTLSVDQYDKALVLLRDAGFDAVTEDALVVSIVDGPGSLARLTERLHSAGIVVSSVRILQRRTGLALVAIAVDQQERAMEAMQDLLVDRIA